MAATMTEEARASYIQSGGACCPFCGGEDLDGHGVNIDSGTASQEVMCTDCGQGWFDIYTLTNVEAA